MSTEQRGYAVISSLDPLEEGKLYHHPVHFKLLPWFTMEADENELVERLTEHSQVIDPFEIIGEGEAGLSHNGQHRARIIGQRAFLAGLHTRLLADTADLSSVFDKPEYTGDNFLPHITPQLNGVRWIRHGQTVKVTELQLVSAVGHADASAVVVKTLPLQERR